MLKDKKHLIKELVDITVPTRRKCSIKFRPCSFGSIPEGKGSSLIVRGTWLASRIRSILQFYTPWLIREVDIFDHSRVRSGLQFYSSWLIREVDIFDHS
ncbi:hypothetical protein RND71_003365 [Anisodus tanguticus]|uniref:Uncharacterized protein n=1 Tax=Anisodus tanguticus TaxID=243964 RepID=A0AAE1SUG1_9SOLA|nr:hypothetical protein RND71_003365 [Anisodus tanguticus]